MGAANNINATYAPVLRAAGWHQTDTGLLWIPPQVKISSPPSNLGVATSRVFRDGIWVREFEIQNRSGGVASVGIGGRTSNLWWKAGRLSADGATYTDTTDAIQGRTTPVTIGVDGANQTGFVFLSKKKFDWISMDITTAGVSAVADLGMQYSTGATWTAVDAASVYTDTFTGTDTPLSQAAHNFVWASPANWAPTLGNGGVPDGYYGLRITVAQQAGGNTAAIATGAEIGRMLVLEALADNGIWEMEVLDFWMSECDGLVAYFSVAGAGNRVYAEVLSR